MSAGPRFELDASVRRRDRGLLLIGGTPPRLIRLSEAGSVGLDAILADDGRLDAAVTTLARRLERGGVLHPLPGDGADDPPVTAIVPVLDGGKAFAGLVGVLAAEGPVIVVDDGSRDGSAKRAEEAGARVIRHDSPRGPGAARNAGLRLAETELVAFVDADCVVAPGWRRGLAGLLAAEPNLALIAPRVRSLPADTAIGRYERRASPLDLGPAASRVGVGRRVSYLPAAALLGRRDALLELGGFDRSMRFGEDVDLVWRLLANGWEARYVPSREALHRPRPTVRALVAQRAGYGSSAPALRRRHGAAVAPLRPGRHAVAVWAVAAFRPRLTPAALLASVALVAARGKDGPARLGLAEVALRGHLDGSRHLARALAREWLPLSLAACALSRRARRPLAAALLLGTLSRASVGLRAIDQAAYAAGLWREMGARRNFAAILPTPPQSRAPSISGGPFSTATGSIQAISQRWPSRSWKLRWYMKP